MAREEESGNVDDRRLEEERRRAELVAMGKAWRMGESRPRRKPGCTHSSTTTETYQGGCAGYAKESFGEFRRVSVSFGESR